MDDKDYVELLESYVDIYKTRPVVLEELSKAVLAKHKENGLPEQAAKDSLGIVFFAHKLLDFIIQGYEISIKAYKGEISFEECLQAHDALKEKMVAMLKPPPPPDPGETLH